MTRVELPPPLVRGTRHPLRWTRNKAKLLLYAVLLAHIGMGIMAALYYGALETYHPITLRWHELVSDKYVRHMIRDIGEGFLGGFLAQQVIWSHFRRRSQERHRLDRLEIRLHIPNMKQPRKLTVWQFLLSPLVAVLYGVPGFILALLAARSIHAQTSHLHVPLAGHTIAAHHPLLEASWLKLEHWWAGTWDKKLIGYGASLFFGRRPMRRVFDDVQLWFARRRANGNPFFPGALLPPPYEARVNDLRASAPPPARALARIGGG